MISFTSLVLLSLTTAYITFVITESDFPPLLRIREQVTNRWGQESWQEYLSTCAWCMSAYVSLFVVGAASWVVNLPLPMLVWLAVAFCSGFLILVVSLISSTNLRNLQHIVRMGGKPPDEVDIVTRLGGPTRGGT